jgi:hypothetical protein
MAPVAMPKAGGVILADEFRAWFGAPVSAGWRAVGLAG